MSLNYVTREGLNNLKTYRYSGTDASLLAKYVMQPYWNWCVGLLPMTMAPNLVTMIGFGFVITSYLLNIFYAPDLRGEFAPKWIFLVISLFQFIYQTLDAIDGKQARRTKTSSPLGELCDHGCDALSSSMMSIQLATALNVGPGWLAFFMAYCGLTPFYFGQWEEYFSGTLDLGYFNVTEAQLLMVFIHLWTGIAGPRFWVDNTLFGIQYNYLLLAFSTMTVLYSTGTNIWHTHQLISSHKAAPDQEKRGNAKLITYPRAIKAALPFITLTVVMFFWSQISPADITYTHPVLFVGIYGMLFANLVGRMVLGRVCVQSFGLIQPVLLPVLIMPILCLLMGSSFAAYEVTLVWLIYFYTVIMYFFFAQSVVLSLTKELNINFLTIKEAKQ